MVSNYKRKTNKASYSRDTLQEAVKAVKNGVLSGYKAAQIYKIPRMTIMDHVNNKRIKSKSLGRNTALSVEVEKKLAFYLHIMEKNGFGLSKTEVLEMVSQYIEQNKLSTPFTNGIPGNAWFAAFKGRNNLSIKKPQAVEFARKRAVNPFIVYPYFDLLNNTLTDLNLWDKPGQIWNLDETSFSKDPQKTKIVGLKGHAATRVIASPGKDNTTVLLGANTDGEKLAPLVIFKGKHMWDEWTSPEAYPGTTYAATTNGWMETAIFERYFKKTFLPAVGDTRPVILIYDSTHSTHVGLNIIEEARKNNITILKLPAHTSHVLQPLDIAVMKSFKDRWDPLLVKWQRLNVGVTLPKKEFARLIGVVWSQIESQVLRNGFRKAGIFPFNPNSIEEKHFDTLKLQQWKNLKDLELQNVQCPRVGCSNCDAKTESKATKNDPKTLLTLALNCITEIVTSSSSVSHMPVTSNKSIRVLEDRIVTFEELLLMKVKAGNNVKTKRQRVAPGAEVITHQDVVLRKMDEKLKHIKKEPTKPRKSNQSALHKKTAYLNINETIDSTRDNDANVTSRSSENSNKSKTSYADADLSLPGPSGLTKNSFIREQQTQKILTVTKKGKGIGKTSIKIKEESQKTVMKTRKRRQKRAYVSSSTSTSVSDCMSIHSDSDIIDFDQDLNESFSETPEEKTMSQNEKNRSRTVNEKTEGVGYRIIIKNEEKKFDSDSSYEDRCDLKNVTVEQTQIENYSINDKVLVRYYDRNKWTYYAGYVEEVKPGDGDVYYKIRYYKTVKKPLKFIVTKKIDRDVVPSINIIKKIRLHVDPSYPKEFKLSNDEDNIYFM